MSTIVEHNLAALLFLPWFLILGTLFWMVPRQPRHAARRRFDLVALAVSVAAFFATIHIARLYSDPRYGHVWEQIVSTAAGYVVFLGALSVAVLLRQRWLRRQQRDAARRAGRLGDFRA